MSFHRTSTHALRRSGPSVSAWVLLVVSLIVGALFCQTKAPPLTIFDQPFYLGIADDLNTVGRFTDGFMFASNDTDGTRPAGMRFAPLYPTLLAVAARLEPGFAAAARCVVKSVGHGPCDNTAILPRAAQALALIAILWLIWWIAAFGFGDCVGVAALGLALCTAPVLMRSVMVMMTEITVLLFDLLAVASALRALRAQHMLGCVAWAGGAGVALGMAALTRPSGVELAGAVLSAGLVALVTIGTARRRLAAALAVFSAAFALTLAPWVGRNARLFEHAALSDGYAGHTLVQRISFDSMTPREYALSFVCWLPDGSGLGAALAGQGTCDRFGWDDHPDSFYAIGMGPLLTQTLIAAGGPHRHLRYLLAHHVLPHAGRHALVTVPLALRGAWINHWWGVALMPIGLWAAWQRRRSPAMWLVAGPAWFMLVFNAAVAVNQPRYNLLLILPYAIGGALAARALWRARRFHPALATTLPIDHPVAAS